MERSEEYAPNAQILLDWFHIVKHLKNPWNLNPDQRERPSTLGRWNTPLGKKGGQA
jgi:hypothetical protein